MTRYSSQIPDAVIAYARDLGYEGHPSISEVFIVRNGKSEGWKPAWYWGGRISGNKIRKMRAGRGGLPGIPESKERVTHVTLTWPNGQSADFAVTEL